MKITSEQIGRSLELRERFPHPADLVAYVNRPIDEGSDRSPLGVMVAAAALGGAIAAGPLAELAPRVASGISIDHVAYRASLSDSTAGAPQAAVLKSPNRDTLLSMPQKTEPLPLLIQVESTAPATASSTQLTRELPIQLAASSRPSDTVPRLAPVEADPATVQRAVGTVLAPPAETLMDLSRRVPADSTDATGKLTPIQPTAPRPAPAPVAAAPPAPQQLVQGARQKIVDLANSQVGVAESGGEDNGVPRDRYAQGRREPWCADFSTWLFAQVGLPFTGTPEQGVYNNNSMSWTVKQLQWLQNDPNSDVFTADQVRADVYDPQPADIVFYKYDTNNNPVNHVGTVVAFEDNPGPDDFIRTVEGNWDDQASPRRVPLSDDNIVSIANRFANVPTGPVTPAPPPSPAPEVPPVSAETSAATGSIVAPPEGADIKLQPLTADPGAAAIATGTLLPVTPEGGEAPEVQPPEPAAPEPTPATPAPVGEVAPPSEQVRAFVAEYGELAAKVSEESGVPREVILAQAMLESAYGDSSLSTQANNFFGVKVGSDWTGETVTKPTMEDYGNGLEPEPAVFRKYATPEEGFMDYADNKLKSGYYDDAFEADTPEEFVHRLVDGNGPNYATDSKYEGKVVALIDQVQGLDQDL